MYAGPVDKPEPAGKPGNGIDIGKDVGNWIGDVGQWADDVGRGVKRGVEATGGWAGRNFSETGLYNAWQDVRAPIDRQFFSQQGWENLGHDLYNKVKVANSIGQGLSQYLGVPQIGQNYLTPVKQGTDLSGTTTPDGQTYAPKTSPITFVDTLDAMSKGLGHATESFLMGGAHTFEYVAGMGQYDTHNRNKPGHWVYLTGAHGPESGSRYWVDNAHVDLNAWHLATHAAMSTMNGLYDTPQHVYRAMMMGYQQHGWDGVIAILAPAIAAAAAGSMVGNPELGAAAADLGTGLAVPGAAEALASEQTAAAATAAADATTAAATGETGAAGAASTGANTAVGGIRADQAAETAIPKGPLTEAEQSAMRAKTSATEKLMNSRIGQAARLVGGPIKFVSEKLTSPAVAAFQTPDFLLAGDNGPLGQIWRDSRTANANMNFPTTIGRGLSELVLGKENTWLSGTADAVTSLSAAPFEFGRALGYGQSVGRILTAADGVSVDIAFNKSAGYRRALNQILDMANARGGYGEDVAANLAGAITRAMPVLEPIAGDIAEAAKATGATDYSISKRISELADIGKMVQTTQLPTVGIYGITKMQAKLANGFIPSRVSRVLGKSSMSIDDLKQVITTKTIRLGEPNAGSKLGELLQQTGMRSGDVTRLVNDLVQSGDIAKWESAVKNALIENFFQRIDKRIMHELGMSTAEWKQSFDKGVLTPEQVAHMDEKLKTRGLEGAYTAIRAAIVDKVENLVGNSSAGKPGGIFVLDGQGHDVSRMENNLVGAVTENQRGDLALPDFRQFDKEFTGLLNQFKNDGLNLKTVGDKISAPVAWTKEGLDLWVNDRFFKPLALLTPGWALRVSMSELALNTARLGPMNLIAGAMTRGMLKNENRALFAARRIIERRVGEINSQVKDFRGEIQDVVGGLTKQEQAIIDLQKTSLGAQTQYQRLQQSIAKEWRRQARSVGAKTISYKYPEEYKLTAKEYRAQLPQEMSASEKKTATQKYSTERNAARVNLFPKPVGETAAEQALIEDMAGIRADIERVKEQVGDENPMVQRKLGRLQAQVDAARQEIAWLHGKSVSGSERITEGKMSRGVPSFANEYTRNNSFADFVDEYTKSANMIADHLGDRGYEISMTAAENLYMIARGIATGLSQAALTSIGKDKFITASAYLMYRHGGYLPPAVDSVHKSMLNNVDVEGEYADVVKNKRKTKMVDGVETAVPKRNKVISRGELKTKSILLTSNEMNTLAFGSKGYIEGWFYGANTLAGSAYIGRPMAAAYLDLVDSGLTGSELRAAAVVEAQKIITDLPKGILDTMSRSKFAGINENDPINSWAGKIVDKLEGIASTKRLEKGTTRTEEEIAAGINPQNFEYHPHEKLLQDIADNALPPHVNGFYAEYGDGVDRNLMPDTVISRTPQLNGTWNVISRIATKGHENVLGPMVNYISRQPTYITDFVLERDKLAARVEAGTMTADQADIIAETAATRKMVKFIHNPSDKTKFEEMMSFAAPFYFAQNQAWRRMGRLFAENPGAFMQYAASMIAVQNVVNKITTQNGISLVTIPGMALYGLPLTTSLSSLQTMDPFSAGTTPDASGTQSLLDMLAPKFGPLVTVPTKLLYWANPGLDKHGFGRTVERQLEGQIGQGESASQFFYQSAMPNSLVRNFAELPIGMADSSYNIKGIGPTNVMDNAYLQAVMEAIRYQVSSESKKEWDSLKNLKGFDRASQFYKWQQTHWDQNTLGGQHSLQDLLDTARKHAGIAWLGKIALGFVLPTSVGLGQADQPMMDKLKRYVSDPKYKGDYYKAIDQFTKDNPWATVDTLYKTKSTYGGGRWAETKTMFDWADRNQSLIESHPMAAMALAPDMSKDTKYYQPAGTMLLNLGIRQRQSPRDFLDSFLVSTGNSFYYNWIKPQYEEYKKVDKSAAYKWEKSMIDWYGTNYNTTWVKSFNENASKTDKLKALSQLNDILPHIAKTDVGKGLQQIYDATMGTGNQPGLYASAALAIKNGQMSARDAKLEWQKYMDEWITYDPQLKQGIMSLFYNLI
jgi:hypothetical protein